MCMWDQFLSYRSDVLQDPLGSLSLTSPTFSRDDNALVPLTKKVQNFVQFFRIQGAFFSPFFFFFLWKRPVIPVRQRVIGVIGNGEDMRRELEGLLSTVQLDVLLSVNGDVLERVHRHNHISNVGLHQKRRKRKKEKEERRHDEDLRTS